MAKIHAVNKGSFLQFHLPAIPRSIHEGDAQSLSVSRFRGFGQDEPGSLFLLGE